MLRLGESLWRDLGVVVGDHSDIRACLPFWEKVEKFCKRWQISGGTRINKVFIWFSFSFLDLSPLVFFANHLLCHFFEILTKAPGEKNLVQLKLGEFMNLV